jgi:RNA polymerase-binding transcription factor DksA
MKTLKQRKAQLTERRLELDSRLQRIEDELDNPLPKDSEDQAIELEEDEVLEGLGSAGLVEIRQIDAALERIEDGTYGTCLNCEERIPEARLDLVPQTALCAGCAAA